MAKTFRGKEFDINKVIDQNKNQQAVGNANLNARGDRVDSKGNVIQTVEQRAKGEAVGNQMDTDYFKNNPSKAVATFEHKKQEQPKDLEELKVNEEKDTKQPKQTKPKAKSKKDQ